MDVRSSQRQVEFSSHEEVEQDRQEGVTYLFCIAFPGDLDSSKAEEQKLQRDAILDDLLAAGLKVLLFRSSTGRQIFCKIGATDSRLLLEADIAQYKLKLNEAAVKQVTETDEPNHRRGAIFLDYPYDFDVSKRDKELKFEYHAIDGSWRSLKQEDAAKYIKRETRLSPWSFLHVRYNDTWEHRILEEHGVQIYETYEDGTILRPADRIKLCKLIMQRDQQEDLEHQTKGAGLHLKKLMFQKQILAVYPLQLGVSRLSSKELTPDRLFHEWNSMSIKPWKQPLEKIRGYAGEKVALYFAFLGHYTFSLVLPAFLGTILFIHQLIQLQDRTGGMDLIGPGASEIIPELQDVTLTNGTVVQELGYRTELYTEVVEAPAFAFFISLWATVFIETWKRRQSRLAMEWGMSDFEQEVQNRVEFKPSHVIPSPIDGKPVPYYSKTTFLSKLAVSASIIGFAILVVVATIGAILVLKVFASAPQFDTGAIPPDVAPQLALVVNAIAIIILGQVYKTIAKKLNDWENWRTNIQYEDALITKVFVFSFANSYSTLFYFAFIKSGRDILGVTQVCIESAQSAIDNATGADVDKILAADFCYTSLAYSLFIIFGTQIVVNNIQEVGLPYITAKIKRLLDFRAQLKAIRKAAKDIGDNVGQVGADAMHTLNVVGQKDMEKGDPEDDEEEKLDLDLDDVAVRQRMKSPLEFAFYLKDYETPFDDYLELALQFGYVTLFVAAFPIAPLLAFINNIIEVKVDSYKVALLSRRPALEEAADIGTWGKIFEILGFVAVLSNAGVILYSSNIIDVEDDVRVWLFLIFIVVVYTMKIVIDFLIPDVPQAVTIQLQRQAFLIEKIFELKPDDDSLSEEEKKRLSMTNSVNRVIQAVDPYILELAQRAAEILKNNEGKDWTWEKLFDDADANRNGTLTMTELKKTLHDTVLGEALSKFEIVILVSSLDVDGDGTITKAEFRRFLSL